MDDLDLFRLRKLMDQRLEVFASGAGRGHVTIGSLQPANGTMTVTGRQRSLASRVPTVSERPLGCER